MNADLALLNEKIDKLAEQVEKQNYYQAAQITSRNGDEIAELHRELGKFSMQYSLVK